MFKEIICVGHCFTTKGAHERVAFVMKTHVRREHDFRPECNITHGTIHYKIAIFFNRGSLGTLFCASADSSDSGATSLFRESSASSSMELSRRFAVPVEGRKTFLGEQVSGGVREDEDTSPGLSDNLLRIIC